MLLSLIAVFMGYIRGVAVVLAHSCSLWHGTLLREENKFIYSTIDGHRHRFQVRAFTTCTAMNVLVRIFW